MTVHSLFSPFPETQTQFETLWKMWPNKAKKAIAKARYEAVLVGYKTRTLDKDSGGYVELSLKATEAEILAGAKAYLDSQFDRNTFRYKDDGRYIPMLSVWTNGGRWMDFE